jgi:folate-binding protein YgfZ
MDDWMAEYRAFTTSGGVVILRDWSQVQLAGEDRIKLLNNMCTNDLRSLETGQSCEAFLLDVKGKISGHVLIVVGASDLTILTVPNQAERIIAHLDRYIIREDVRLTDVGHDYDWWLAVGPDTVEKNASTPTFKCDVLWPGGTLLRKTKGAAVGQLPAVDTESPVWTALRVESFFPLFGSDFDESHLPQEVNRDAQTISFTKGCYLGQETVARIDALGHVNKKLVLVKFDGAAVPVRAAKLTRDGQEVGTVTTASWSPRFEAPLAIAFVRRGSNDVGSKLASELGSVEVIQPAVGTDGLTIKH